MENMTQLRPKQPVVEAILRLVHHWIFGHKCTFIDNWPSKEVWKIGKRGTGKNMAQQLILSCSQCSNSCPWLINNNSLSLPPCFDVGD